MPLKSGKSKAVISENISEFHTGKTYAHTKAKFGKKKADAQAVAAAMSNARRYGRAEGGKVIDQDFDALDAQQAIRDQDADEAKKARQPAYGFQGKTVGQILSEEREREAKLRGLRARAGYAKGGATHGEHYGGIKGVVGLINSSVPGRTDKLPMKVPAGAYVVPSSVVSALGQDNTMAGAKVLEKMFHSGPGGMKLGKHDKHGMMKHFAQGGSIDHPKVPIVAAGGEFLIHPEAIVHRFGSLKHGHKILDSFVKAVRKKHIKTLAALPGPKG